MTGAGSHDGFYPRFVKRIFDLLAAVVVGILTFPIQVVVATFVRRKMGSPVLYREERPGRGGKPFTIFKFRTMTNDRGPDGELLPDEDRLPAFGRFLRSTSLDELPEVANVVRGDMSLVGPRPLLLEYLPRYSERQSRRHDVRPGITGWAQVNGRNAIDWPEKLEMDVWYTENLTLGLDLRILWMTLASVIHRKDISAEGHVTAPEFTG